MPIGLCGVRPGALQHCKIHFDALVSGYSGFHPARTSTMEADDSPADPDVLVARAMDRALEAERAAQAAIADCERQAAEALERARQQRRTILEHAQTRITALHRRAAGKLQRQAADIAARSLESAATAVEQLSDPERRTRALERLAARLTNDDAEQPSDAR